MAGACNWTQREKWGPIMRRSWETPRLTAFGSVSELTQQFKRGSASDWLTGLIPIIDGSWVPIDWKHH